MKSLIEAIINEAEHMMNALDAVPGWVGDAGVDMPRMDNLEDAIEAYRSAVKAETVAARKPPSSVADVVARLIEDHDDQKQMSADRAGDTWGPSRKGWFRGA